MILNLIKKIVAQKNRLRAYMMSLSESYYYREYFIDSKKKLIFLVISKNACSSIKKTFLKKKIEDAYSIHTDQTANQFRKNKIAKSESDMFKFCFVRNPFDRIYSCYKSKLIHDPKNGFNHFQYYLFGYLSKSKSFDDFVKRIVKIPDCIADRHFHSQYNYIYKTNTHKIDFIGKFENLERDFEPIRKKYGLEELPNFNKTQNNKAEWKNYYTKNLADLVHQKYKKDFDIWYPTAHKELIEHLNKGK